MRLGSKQAVSLEVEKNSQRNYVFGIPAITYRAPARISGPQDNVPASLEPSRRELAKKLLKKTKAKMPRRLRNANTHAFDLHDLQEEVIRPKAVTNATEEESVDAHRIYWAEGVKTDDVNRKTINGTRQQSWRASKQKVKQISSHGRGSVDSYYEGGGAV